MAVVHREASVIGHPDAHWIEMDRIVFKRRKPDDPPAPDAEARAEKPAGVALPMRADPSSPPRPADSGLGVPPFRPASPKEPSAMGRSPFPSSPTPAPSAAP